MNNKQRVGKKFNLVKQILNLVKIMMMKLMNQNCKIRKLLMTMTHNFLMLRLLLSNKKIEIIILTWKQQFEQMRQRIKTQKTQQIDNYDEYLYTMKFYGGKLIFK